MTGHYPAAHFGFATLVAYVLAIAAWITHVVTCIKAASWALLFIGAIIFPVGVIHGWGIWLGVW